MATPQSKPSDTRTAILRQAVSLFAQMGYSGVSMRDIARDVGISAAALYHHFPDKENLYLEALRHVFVDFAEGVDVALDTTGSSEERLARFVRSLVELFGGQPLYRRLHQRVLLDGDETRAEILVSEMFREQFESVARLIAEIAPGCDAHMVVFSISAMVIQHFEMAPLRRFFPGSRPEHEESDYVTNHVTQLLLHGIKGMKRE